MAMAYRDSSLTPSDRTRTTDDNYDNLCQGIGRKPCYAFNIEKLKGQTVIAQMEMLLYTKLQRTIEDLEDNKTITKLYIGKAYVNEKIRKNFDPSDFDTWGRDGISRGWRQLLEKTNYMVDGMVVLGLVTDDNLPKDFAASHEKLATNLVKGLLQRCKDDGVEVIRTEASGKHCKAIQIGYAIFMAFGYE